MTDQTPATIPPSEREKVAREEKDHAMRELREDANSRMADRGGHPDSTPIDHAGEPGQWPGKELTRNTVPHAADDPDREALSDDVYRDISQDGVTHDPEKTVERAP